MCDETNEERQDNELAALQAIYVDAVTDNRENIAWKVWRPLDLMLTLNPLHNSDIQGIHCSVTLHIKCCHKYPDKPPTLSIHKMHGLSKENVAKLLTELENLALELCGEVMIFQLATHTQQFLHDHNKPSLSCYDEMLKEKNEMEQLKLHDMKVKEDEERQKIKDEIQRRQEMLRVAGKRVHRSSISQENSIENNNNDGAGDTPELVYYADDKVSSVKKQSKTRAEVPCTCENRGVQVLRITQRNNKKVYVSNCLGHSPNTSTTYLAIDNETGERLIAKKWIIPPVTDFQLRNRQLTSLQNDLKLMCRIKSPSLVPYIALEICKETTKRTLNQCIYVFRNFILGSSLKYVKNRLSLVNDSYEALKLLRHVGSGVLRALKELHSEGVIHRDVRSENVFLDENGGVKLVGAALDARLTEMVEGDCNDRQTASQDIYSTGQMLLSLVASERTYIEIPPELPSSAKDFFARCLTEDEQSQWSAEQLVNHVFLIDAPSKEPCTRVIDPGSESEDEYASKRIPQVSMPTNGHSRLHAEFEVLTWLGKGAFGDVLKVKNKLDGGFYAIKRVKLNPESVQLNKKITREVKLLSRLNHENVVRYYNAWIETTIDQDTVDSSNHVAKSPSLKSSDDSLQGIVAKLGQEVKVEWSMSEGPVQKDISSDSEDEDDDDEADPWFNIMSPENEGSSEGIEFEEDSQNQSLTVPSEDVVDAARPKSARLHKVLYIQMEFCEKHTLRQAIDNGLHHEQFRAWRLFREIVEGLAHVHQRGMIHRDLKPVNIFLDSNDHVKIGDFGLATKVFTGLPVDEKIKQTEEIGGSLTGQIGTALYVAPELLQSSSKVIYNQKVDIYSLGIILFEMFHPLTTAMERMAVLTDLRSPAIVVPKRFDTEENTKQIQVVRWLLSHSPSCRPSCAELLSSSAVPRAVAEGAAWALVSRALCARAAKPYERLVRACLDQRHSAAEDYTYHGAARPKCVTALACLQEAVVKIFQSHGAIEFSPPLLTPRASSWDQHVNAVKVMTASGFVCHLPHDLRLPFARHTAYSDIKNMRRYCVERVYRERHVQGFHPREILECAFDIVTPKTDSLWSDAELLTVASRAAAACSFRVAVQLNHSELLRMLLLSCGVALDKHADIYPVLVDVSLGRITNLQLQTHLTSLCITNRRNISNLLRLMEADVPIQELKELVTPLVKQAKLSKCVTRAVNDLDTVCKNAVTLGFECQITVAPFLAYNATQHSGVFWQMYVMRDDYKHKHKHRSGDIIAAGGRYDALVEEFWKVARAEKDQDNMELKSCSVGFSMDIERMAAILKKTEPELPTLLKNAENTLVYISAGCDRAGAAARALWAGGAAVALIGEHVHDLRKPYILLTYGDTSTRVVCDDGRRVREYKLPHIDVLDFVKQQLNQEIPRCTEGPSRTISWTECDKPNSPNISVTFITASDKMTKMAKRSCENQINTQITSSLVSLGLQPVLGRARVCVVALAVDGPCVRQLAATLHHPPREEPHLNMLLNSYPKRQNILEEAVKELCSMVKQNNQTRSTDEIQLYALYSISDSVCKLIT